MDSLIVFRFIHETGTETSALNDSIIEEGGSNDTTTLTTTPNARRTLRPTESFRYLKTERNDRVLEVSDVLEQNIAEIKDLLNIFLDSIFSTIYNLPLHVRLFLKLLESRIAEQFESAREDLQLIFSNFLFLKWIIPKFSRPVFTGIGFDEGFLEKQQKNLMLLGGILHKVVRSSLYDQETSEFVCFNAFIEENKF